MIADLNPYAEYRESGLPWLGQVPEHWGLIPNRGLIRRRKVLVGKHHQSYKLLSLTKSGVIVRDVANGKGKFSSDMGTSQEVRKGDLVFCLFDVPETPRTVGLSYHSGMITGAYTVFECSNSKTAEYFELFYRMMDDRKLLSPLYSGLRHTIPPQRFLGTKTPQPPADEQAAIVRFLDWANGRLGRAIRAKRKVIALLNEQKQAIIHRAVTRGLDPNVPLKPSGIPWLGDIPQHWQTIRLSRLSSKIGDGLHGTPQYVDISPYHFINGNNLINGEIRLKSSTRCVGEAEFRKYRVIIDDSSLLMSINGTIGNVAYYRGQSIVLGKSAAYINCSRELARPYLFFFLQSPAVVNFLQQEVTGTTIFNLSLASIRSLPIALPSLGEQLQIVFSIEDGIAPISTAITRLEREIELLREYRTRLVADVVTGKLDVREAAARLPGEITPDTIEDVADEIDEIEPSDEETAE